MDHPILVHKLNRIRDLRTQRGELVRLLEELSSLMVYEVFRGLEMQRKEIETWIGRREFEFINEGEIVFVPIMRAGLPMLEGALRVVPSASVGFMAIKRNEETLEPTLFYSRLPDLNGRIVLILDPMLATGGTILLAISEVLKGRPRKVMSLHLVCAPEGIERVERERPEHVLFTVSVDEGLNDKGYILPGLGDMGDRLFS